MSTIISYSIELGMPSILIHAPDSRTVISATDIEKHLIQIDGHTEKPFIHCVRFFGCVIVAENFRAFDSCYFDSCTMNVKNMPVVNGQSINCNHVAKVTKVKKFPSLTKEVIADVKRAEEELRKESKKCKCIGGCIESDCHGKKNKSNLPDGIYCQISKNN